MESHRISGSFRLFLLLRNDSFCTAVQKQIIAPHTLFAFPRPSATVLPASGVRGSSLLIL